jgi:hypothetical protein
MTIQEAIKSGKPFKRKPWVGTAWIYPRNMHSYTRFAVSDILADDWEVKE